MITNIYQGPVCIGALSNKHYEETETRRACVRWWRDFNPDALSPESVLNYYAP